MSSFHHDMIQQHCLPLLELCRQSASHELSLPTLQRRASNMLGLHLLTGHESSGGSDLTPSGLPMMLRTCGPRTLLIADAGWCFADPHERLMATRSVFSSMLAEQERGELHIHYHRLLATLLTCERDVLFQGVASVVSLGTDLEQKQSVVNARVTMLPEHEAWEFVHSWYQDVLPEQTPHLHMLRVLRASHFVPHSVNVGHRDGVLYASMEFSRQHTPGEPAAKRLLPSLDGLADERLVAFLTAIHDLCGGALEDERLRVEIELSTGRTLAWGISFAPPTSVAITRLLPELERRVSMVPCAMATALSPSVEVMRLGLVLEQDGSHMACCELELSVSRHGPPRLRALKPEHVDRCIHHAREALVARQSPEGQWPGLQELPFGGSSTFVTAFAGLALARTGSESAFAMASARRAAQWLDIMRGNEQGWGLGPHIGADVMTTSLVMHLFKRTRHVIAQQDRDWLLGHWARHEGGFRFSDGPLHWGDVQPDVTALAWPLLEDAQQNARRPKLHDYLAAFAPEDGIWPSYWWTSPLLSTYFHLVMFEQDDELRGQFSPDSDVLEDALTSTSNFELAWACACATRAHFDDLALELGVELLRRQQIDGGWQGGKELRLTSPTCDEPWREARGELIRDVQGCLATSSALWALAELAEMCQAREDLHYL